MESIKLSQIIQMVKDKYHMISPVSGLSPIKQIGKQNITRNIEIKNKLIVTRVDGGGC